MDLNAISPSLHFEPVRADAAGRPDFVTRGPGYQVWLESGGRAWTRVVPGGEASAAVIGMEVVGARVDSVGEPLEPRFGVVHRYLGNDPADWETNLPTFGRVRYHEVLPDVDLVYYGNGGAMPVSLGATLLAG